MYICQKCKLTDGVTNGYCVRDGAVQTILKGIVVEPKPGWVVYYKNGKSYPQYNLDGTENPYALIDRSQLKLFEFRVKDKVVVTIPALKKRQFLYRKTTTITNGIVTELIYKIGYFLEKKIVLIYYHPHDLVELPDGDIDDIVLTKEERKWQP